MMLARMLDLAVIGLAILVGVGSLVLLVAGMGGYVDLGLPVREALSLDALLSLAFFLQHSIMVRRPVKAAIARLVPGRYVGAIYAIASGLVLTPVVLLWQRTEVWYVAHGPLRWIALGLTGLAAAGFVWGIASLRSTDLLGVRAVWSHRAGLSSSGSELQIRGAYRWVRHPLYLCVLVLFWATPFFSADRLLFCVSWSAWVVMGTFLEERDLVAEMGEPYRAYRRRVPMLFPWRPPAPPT